MLNLSVIITPIKDLFVWSCMEVIYLQQLLIECLEKYNFLKIAQANSIFADVQSVIELSRQHFFTDVKEVELERLSAQGMHKITARYLFN